MIRTRTTRRLLAVLTAALVTFALSACDPTPVMLSGTVTFDDSGSPAGGTVVSVLTVGGTQVASQTTGVEGTFRFHESVLPAGEQMPLGLDEITATVHQGTAVLRHLAEATCRMWPSWP